MKNINLSDYDITTIQKLVTQSLKVGSLILVLNDLYKINLNEIKCTQKDLKVFSTRLQQGCFSNNEMVALMQSCINNTEFVEKGQVNENIVEKSNDVENLKSKTKTVSELRVGDIVYHENLKHPFLILNTYKSGLFKSVSLSSSPDTRQEFVINSRFLDKTSYIRLTVSINEIEEFKSKWLGNTSQSQVKLVKLYLKHKKL